MNDTINDTRNDTETVDGHVCLLIHHYGPSGHTGGFRWHSITTGLAQRGWTFDVVTSTPAAETSAPDGVTVHTVDDEWIASRVRASAARTLAPLVRRLMGRLRTSRRPASVDSATPRDLDRLPAPDAPWPGRRRELGDVSIATQIRRDLVHATELLTQAVWTRRVGRVAATLDRRPDIVVTTSPAELLHLTGSKLAAERGAKHVMDFRDLWVVGRPSFAMRSRPLRWLGRRYELALLRRAALAVDIASPPTEVRRELGVVPCAFVPSGWAHLDREPLEPDPDRFRIVYAGWLYDDMDLRPLFDACAHLVAARPEASDVLSIELVGTPTELAGIALADLAAQAGVPDTLTITPRLPREECTRHEERAAVLACFGFTDGMHTPSKLYGYARLRGRLLLIGQRDDATARDAASIGVVAHQDGESAADVLIDAFDRWTRGGPWPINDPDGLLSDDRPILRYDHLLRALVHGAGDLGAGDLEAGDLDAAIEAYGAPLPPAEVTLAARHERALTPASNQLLDSGGER